MLPTHIPASFLSRILKDFTHLVEKDCDPGMDPREWIAGCRPEDGEGYFPSELDTEDRELDPFKRLKAGEELAISLHTVFTGDKITLIDGREYLPTGGPQDDENERLDESEDRDEDGEWDEFPQEADYYALGLQRDGDQLRIRPIVMYSRFNPGGQFYESDLADFPASFMTRIEAYIASLR